MGHLRILMPDENLETFRREASELYKRPAYFAACRREPLFLGAETVQGLLTSEETKLCMYMSDTNAEIVRMIVPVRQTEKSPWLDAELGKDTSTLFKPWGSHKWLMERIAFVEKDMKAFPELIPFVSKISVQTTARKSLIPSIVLFVSGPFLVPEVTQEKWWVGKEVRGEYHDYDILFPPGRYNDNRSVWVMSDDHNSYLISEAEVGRCIVCHGRSGSGRYFGRIRHVPDPVPSGLICAKCAPEVFRQWLELLGKEEK